MNKDQADIADLIWRTEYHIYVTEKLSLIEVNETQKQAIREVFGINPHNPVAHIAHGDNKILVMFTKRAPTEHEMSITSVEGVPVEVKYVGEIKLC